MASLPSRNASSSSLKRKASSSTIVSQVEKSKRARSSKRTTSNATASQTTTNVSLDSDECEAVASSQDISPPSWNGMPTNKVLPAVLKFDPKQGVRIVSWNICGLAAAIKKGLLKYLTAEDPDIIVLTETKVNQPPADPSLVDRFPHRYWSVSEKKGQAGTAILSKYMPLSVTYNLPGYDNPSVVKGRIVTLEFNEFWLIGTYVPNAGAELKTLGIKNAWNTAFQTYIHNLDRTKPVIWAGDLNVAPTSKDLKNDKSNWNKTAGYTSDECSAFARILENLSPTATSQVSKTGDESSITNIPKSVQVSPTSRLLDIWRETHPDDEHYTYFSFRFNCRAKQVGWRLDMCRFKGFIMPQQSLTNSSHIKRENPTRSEDVRN
ncbi:Endonuclease/exonuclease/phosphatase [Cantharellus anzutake]|uniref:Endonuclease/exonuclease/phosphatase n=1 Tax=Cantharellus anzutake TaxID=1750568 RepID=UPI0019064FDF|nr:Endonuclease/exonuclease/phosphatase [Cantharellus anzutake]KAF8343897.1 Endonuclease/exonuclease/phosphatase [Cantharellus anzutake]